MKNRYEGLMILNVKGNDENAREIVERLEGEFKKEGAEVEQVQKIGQRHFSYVAGHSESGFYVNFIFQGEPQIVDRLRNRFKLQGDVYRQYFLRVPVRKPHPVRAAKVAK